MEEKLRGSSAIQTVIDPSFTFGSSIFLELFSLLLNSSKFYSIHTLKMGRSALLIGNITHARKEWEELGSLIELKVGGHSVISRMNNR